MRTNKWVFALAVGMLLAVLLACNFSASTASIRSLKVSKDEAGMNEATNFKPGETVYAVADIAYNVGKVQTKFRVLYDDVAGQKAGTFVEGAEKTLDVEGSRPAIFWIKLPASGFHDGRYKFEVTMLNEKGEQKDQKTATFDVSGYGEP